MSALLHSARFCVSCFDVVRNVVVLNAQLRVEKYSIYTLLAQLRAALVVPAVVVPGILPVCVACSHPGLISSCIRFMSSPSPSPSSHRYCMARPQLFFLSHSASVCASGIQRRSSSLFFPGVLAWLGLLPRHYVALLPPCPFAPLLCCPLCLFAPSPFSFRYFRFQATTLHCCILASPSPWASLAVCCL